MELVIIAVTFLATLLGAISGIGGGMIIKPVMDALSEYSVSTIGFLSGNTVLAMTAIALARNRKDTIRVDSRVGIPLAIGASLGGVIGKLAFNAFKDKVQNDALIGLAQNIVIVLLTVTVLVYILSKNRIQTLRISNKAAILAAGVILGVLSSFLGIGGGPINIMFLSFLFSMDAKHASLNSLYIIFFSQAANLAANIVQTLIPNFSAILLAAMMVSAAFGSIAGRKISKLLSNRQIDRLFIGIMLVIILISAYNIWRFALVS